MLVIYILIAINILTFIVYGIDKFKARHNKWRIPEATLILFATLLCGSFGAALGMLFFHHKTRKPKFFITVPVFVIIHSVFLAYYLIKVL